MDNNFRDLKYVQGSLWRAYKNMFNTVQQDEEDFKTFYDRFKNVVDVIENYGGDIGGMTNLWKNEVEVKDEGSIFSKDV